MDLANKTCLVTGADGFIGSHVTEQLAETGANVKALACYNSFNSWGWLENCSDQLLDSIEVAPGDIRDPHHVHDIMKDCDLVFHLAALIAIPYSYRAPQNYVDTNCTGSLNILQAARSSNVQKVIHTSSSEVYGSAQYVPIDEDHPLNAQSPYAATKIGADQLALSFHRSYDLPVAVIRPFNTYGPRQSARAVIPTIITQLLEGDGEIELGALSPTRDFSYASDTARAFLEIARSSNTTGEVMNAGSGFEISIQRTAELIADVMDVDLEITSTEERMRPQESEVDRLYASIDKITRLTEWTPKFSGESGFKQGIEKTVDWFSQPANLDMYKADRYNV